VPGESELAAEFTVNVIVAPEAVTVPLVDDGVSQLGMLVIE
jgi:hypothetical protein